MSRGSRTAAPTLVGAVSIALVVGLASPVPASESAPSRPAGLSSAPDRLAYSAVSGDSVGLVTTGLHGEDRRVVTAPVGYGEQDRSPQWSPDGRWLAFTHYPGESDPNHEYVEVVPRDGGPSTVVTRDGFGPAWSPDGLHLAWTSIDDTGRYGVQIATVLATQDSITFVAVRMLVPPQNRKVGWLHFSPDGLQLAYYSGQPDQDAVLAVVTVAGGPPLRISHGLVVNGGPNSVLWSPTGLQLLVLAGDKESPTAAFAYVVTADGSSQTRLDPGTSELGVAWSPTGTSIAMASSTYARGLGLYGLDGRLITRISNDFRNWSALTFSPDGRSIVTVATRGQDARVPQDLYAIPVNGDPPTRLTDDHSVFDDSVQAMDPGRVLRLLGIGPISEALAVSRATFASASDIVITARGQLEDALAAAPFAATLHAPLLVTAASLSHPVRREISRLGARRVWVVGSVAQRTIDALRSTGATVRTVGRGSSATTLAARLGRRYADRRATLVPLGSDPRQFFGLQLAAAGFAATGQMPLLYARKARLPRTTKRLLRRSGIRTVTLVDGSRASSRRLERALNRLDVRVHVVSDGPGRASARLATHSLRSGASAREVYVTAGSARGASISTAAAAGASGEVQLLVGGLSGTTPGPAESWLDQHSRDVRTGQLVGTPRQIEPQVETRLERLI